MILGGAQENTLITCRLLAERGHDVTLITGPAEGPEGELFTKALSEPYDIITIPSMIRPIRPIQDITAYRQLKKHLKKIKPDIVHTHSAKAGILGRYAGYSIKNKWQINSPAVIHTIHGLAFHDYQSKWLNKFYIAIEKATATKTDAFICVADAMTTQALEAGIGRPEQFTTAYSAIEEDAFLNPVDQEKLTEFRVNLGISKGRRSARDSGQAVRA